MVKRNGRKMVTTQKPFSLTLFTEFGDFKSFREMRFIIRLKENKAFSNPKVASPILHETQGFWMLEWLRLIIRLYRKRKRNEQFIYDPKFHSIILTWNSKISDGCLNKRLLIVSHEYAIRKICIDSLYGPKVHSIILAQNPRVLDECLNKRLIIGSYKCIMNNKQ